MISRTMFGDVRQSDEHRSSESINVTKPSEGETALLPQQLKTREFQYM